MKIEIESRRMKRKSTNLWWYPARLILSRFWLGSQLLGISSSAEGGGGEEEEEGRRGGREGGGWRRRRGILLDEDELSVP